MEYYLHEAERLDKLPGILDLIGPSRLFASGNLPVTIGAFLWQSFDGNSRHVDLVNYALDLEADRIEAAEEVSFLLRVPAEWQDVDIETITPDELASAACVIEDGWVKIQMNRLVHYVCIKITRRAAHSSKKQRK
jgi:hypothetical protein